MNSKKRRLVSRRMTASASPKIFRDILQRTAVAVHRYRYGRIAAIDLA
jgi:hypothetical protein